MNPRIRTTLAALATVAASTGAILTPTATHADEVACPAAEELQAALVSAVAENAAAKQAFKESQRPLGQLVKAQRHESRDAVADLQRSLKDLRAAVRAAATEEEAAAAAAAFDKARADLREHRSLLTSKRALLAEIKADRREAQAAWAEARAALSEVRALAEICTDEGTDEETGDETGEESTTP